ncbi:MAG: hypothetical protein P8X67_04355 [Syntrophobacterales bacterium]|jgi:hypothetical protein
MSAINPARAGHSVIRKIHVNTTYSTDPAVVGLNAGSSTGYVVSFVVKKPIFDIHGVLGNFIALFSS